VLKSGQELKADIIVTATGFNLSVLGDIQIQRRRQAVNFSDTVTYRGMMFTGVPNMVWVFGYFRASWTLRVDLHRGFRLPAAEPHACARLTSASKSPSRPDRTYMQAPALDGSGELQSELPHAQHAPPAEARREYDWQHTQDYWREKDEIPAINLGGAEFIYG
jgi:cation diffusion facilitator CzcD-associated flavoprotein CzcO